MKEKILAALRSKYANLGLSDKALLGIAAMLAITTTDETGIDAAITAEGVVEALKGIQSEGDRRAQLEKDKKKPADPDKPEPDKPEPAKPDPNETATDKLLKSMLEEMKTLKTEIGTIKGGEVAKTRRQELEIKLKDAPEVFKKQTLKNFDRMQFEKDEDFTGYLTELEADVTEAIQGQNNNELSVIGAPVVGALNSDGIGMNTQAYIDKKKADTATGDLGGKKV